MFLGFGRPQPHFVPSLMKGDTRCVPEFTWVHLTQAARNRTNYFRSGDRAVLPVGGGVTVVGFDEQHGILARYSHPEGASLPVGVRCPDGGMFFLRAETLASWPEEVAEEAYKLAAD